MCFCRIEIITRIERNYALQLIKDTIGACEGWIVTHQLFSNISASINFEMPSNEIEPFVGKLSDAGFFPRSAKKSTNIKDGDVRGLISVTFVHDEPDLKRDVPAFG